MRTLFTALALLVLAACNTTSVPEPLAPPHFNAGEPISLQVKKITFVNAYHAPNKAPNVEHTLRYTLPDMLKTWTHERIQAAGGDATLEITIKNASIVDIKLPLTRGIEGLLTIQQAERFDGKLSIEMRIYKPGEAMSAAEASAEVSRSSTLAENPTLQQRDQLLYDLSVGMMRDMGKKLDENMHQYFGAYTTSPGF